MPDDTTPEPTDNVPSEDASSEAATPETWDTATQATPAATPSDLTQSIPADTTRSMAGITPPTGTPVTSPGGAAPGAPLTPNADGGPPKRSSQRAWIIALVAAAVLLAGTGIALAATSGGGTKKPSQGAPNVPGPSTTNAQGPLCPLTGLAPSGGTVPARPALAVKIDNYPDARPQSGLDQADIVFEEPVEGGITRFAAVFQCQSPALIGPIRSARLVDLQILDQLSKPILVHVGGIDPVLSLLRAGNLTDFDLRTHGSVIQKLASRFAPYNTYMSAAGGWGLEPGDTTPPAPLFTYSSTPPSGAPVTSIHIPFTATNNTLWTWNAPSGRWELSYSGRPATIANGPQITTTNVVVQTVHVTYGPWLENSVGGLEVQSQMTGSGPVTVLRNGVAVTGTWKRAAVNDPTTMSASDGSIIALQPGQTWVEIVPSTVPVTTTGPIVSTPTSP